MCIIFNFILSCPINFTNFLSLLLGIYYDKTWSNKLELTRLVGLISRVQLNSMRSISSRIRSEPSLLMPGTHDLLAFIGETMCILIDCDDNDSYAINMSELFKLSSLNIDNSMNLTQGVVNFMQNDDRKTSKSKELLKKIYDVFHASLFNSVYEWKSLNHSFNLKIVSFNSIK